MSILLKKKGFLIFFSFSRHQPFDMILTPNLLTQFSMFVPIEHMYTFMERLYSHAIPDTLNLSERKIHQRLFFTVLCFIPFGMFRLVIQATGRSVLPEMILLFTIYLAVLLLVFHFKQRIHLCHWLLVVVCVASACLFSLASKSKKKNLKTKINYESLFFRFFFTHVYLDCFFLLVFVFKCLFFFLHRTFF